MIYYNENDPKAAAWLGELIQAGLIAPGIVDDRSIHDVQADDIRGFDQCHFFAGIGGWSYALRLAGWSDNRPVWTGSCPCPPFSSAGKKKRCPDCGGKPMPHPRKTGIFACIDCAHEWYADERHLWPEMLRLITECQPTAIFGEQVASADGRVWLAGVRATLEAVGYAVGGADLCAAGVGAPHIRQRLFWVADAEYERAWAGEQGQQGQARGGGNRLANCGENGVRLGNADRSMVRVCECGSDAGTQGEDHQEGDKRQRVRYDAESAGDAVRLVNADIDRCGTAGSGGIPSGIRQSERAGRDDGVALGDTIKPGLEGHAQHGGDRNQPERNNPRSPRPVAPPSWDDFDLVRCVEPTKEPGRFVEKWRRVEPGTLPLAHGIPGRVGLLRGYGNAIVPEVAAAFVRASSKALTELKA